LFADRNAPVARCGAGGRRRIATVAFLVRRLLGQKWYDVPSHGSDEIEVAGTGHYRCPYANTPAGHDAVSYPVDAVLEREPSNRHDPNAVRVAVNGKQAGHLPADIAPAWSQYLATLEAGGYRARVAAVAWVGTNVWRVYLRTGWLTPLQLAEREERKAAGVCPVCGGPVERGKHGARRVYCLSCSEAGKV
jgi:hypothetical protein